VTGHPLLPYAPAGQALYPNANGPVALVPLAMVGALLRALGQMDVTLVRRALTFALAAIFLLLMTREAVRAIERMRGPLQGLTRMLLYAAFTVGPTLWQGVVGYGHVEQPIEMWLILLAAGWIIRRHAAGSGVALGLAVLTRSSAALFAIPLAVAVWQQRKRHALLLLTSAVGVVALGLLPFYLADSSDVVHSLVTYRGDLPVGAGSIWSLARTTSLAGIGQHADILFVTVAVAGLSAWLARRQRDFAGEKLYAALAVTAAAYALLVKTMWPYYLVEVYVLILVWAAARPGVMTRSLRYLPAALVAILAGIGEIGVLPNQSLRIIQAEGVLMFCALGALTLWTAWRASESRTSH